MFTEDQIIFIQGLAARYHMRLTDGWRCDFCEPDCNCDEIYLDGLENDYMEKFLTTENLWKVREMIIDY